MREAARAADTGLSSSRCGPRRQHPKNLSPAAFFGECGGEECIEIYCLESSRLLEDENDTYPNATNFYVADFSVLPNSQFNEVDDLMDYFPDTLLTVQNTVIGQPDAGDWGGLYIEYNVGGNRQFWLLDQKLDNVPASLHPFIEEVNPLGRTITLSPTFKTAPATLPAYPLKSCYSSV